MRFNNYISKLIILIVIGMSSFNSNAQRIVMDSVSFPSPQIVCEQDTISYYFVAGVDTATGLPFNNPTIHIDLPSGFKFVDIIYTENINSGNVPSSNIDASNPDDLLFRVTGFLGRIFQNNPPYEIKIIVEPSCGANPSKSRSFITKGLGNIPISDTITTNTIQVREPYVVFQGVSNTTSTNSTIDLTRLAIGQKYQRCFKVNYTSLISSISELTVVVPNTNNYYSFDWVTPGVTKTIVNDTVYYVFDGTFFATIGDGDGVIEPGESFNFCDSVTVLGNCNSQNSNIKLDYFMQWGCGGSLCQNDIVAVEGIIALSPTKLDVRPRLDLLVKPNLCDTCGSGFAKYGFEMVNNTQAVLPSGGFLSNLVIELGTAIYPYTIPYAQILGDQNFCFDSVKINGVIVPFTKTAKAEVNVSKLTAFSGTGLQDLDGDTFFDDLAVGDTLVVEVFGTLKTEKHDHADFINNLSGGNIDIPDPDLIDAVSVSMDVIYFDECGGNEKEKRSNSTPIYLDPHGSTSSVIPDFFDRQAYTYTMVMSEWNTFNEYDCDSAVREIMMILPKDVSLDTTQAYPFTNYPSISATDSVVGWVEKNGPNDVDTLYIYYNTKGYNNGTTFHSSVDLRYDCSGGLCPEADSLRRIQWFQNYKCYNLTNNVCYNSALYNGSRLVRFHCDQPPQGISLRTFNMERVTFGYTDSTETAKVNRTTPGIALHTAMVADTVRVLLKGVVNNAVLDSAHARFSYHTQYGQEGIKQILRVDPSKSRVHLYDASAGTHHSFVLNAPGMFSGEFGPQQSGTTPNYDFQWNLSSYKDSIGGGYQFTGGFNDSTTWDSVNMEIYFIIEDNTYAGQFQIDPYAQMVELPQDTATQCDIYGGLFSISQRALSYYVQPAVSMSSCNNVATQLHFYNGSSGAGNYPNEYKRNEEIDEIRFSWNPTYFNDPDSITIDYRWGAEHGNAIFHKTVSYTQTGNSIVIPMERSTNINVLPEYLHWTTSYISVYHTPNCSVEDSMPTTNLEMKGEMDFTRFTNSSVTSSVTLYDTNSIHGAAGLLYVDPTPFNITSSPIVAPSSNDSVCWKVTYTNLSEGDIDFTWLDFSADSLKVTSVVRCDSGFSVPKTLYSYGTNGLWVQTDTINSNDFKTYRVCAQSNSCDLDSIVITGGWNCLTYPTDPNAGYPPTAYSCETNQQQVSIYMDVLGAKLQANIKSQTAMPIQICDTLSYDIQIANIDLTDMNNLVFSAILPPSSNLSNVNGSTKIIWPFDGTNTTLLSVADPTVTALSTGDSLAWDLTPFFDNAFLRNFEIPADSNFARITVKFNTQCLVLPGEDIRFNVQGERGCGETHLSRDVVSRPFQVLGLQPKANRAVDIKVNLDTIQACDTATQVDIAFFNMYAKTSRGSEVIAVTFPASFDFSGTIYNRHRDSLLDTIAPTNTVTGNLRTLEWTLLPGMPISPPWIDSLSFSFSIVPVTDVTCAIDTLIEAKTFERYILYCVSDSTVPCEVIYNLDDANSMFKVSKGEFSFNNVSAVLNGCNDSIAVAFDYSNSGSAIAAGTQTKFSIVADANSNGVYDITDPIIDSIVLTTAIAKGSTGTLNKTLSQTQFTGGEICTLFILLDSNSSCVCDTTYVATSVSIDMQLTGDTICDNDTSNFNVCAGTGNYGARTYTWYDIDASGRQIYLSNVNALSPTFTPPVVTVNTLFRYGIQVNRGGCVSEDTMEILVKAAPLPFTVMDDTICAGDCASLTTTMQAGVTYNVYAFSGAFLGTLPYSACPTTTSTYYIEAVDPTSGCGSVRDTAVVTVIAKQSPGVNATVSTCGIGCTLNLFNTLGGTPDTTGTWKDPSGTAFGTGHNVTFSSALHVPGVYTYTISNLPCNDTSATVTILQVTDTIRDTIPEDTTITLCPPVLSSVGSIGTMAISCVPSNGTTTIDTITGCMTYKPDTNYVGLDTICVVTCDTMAGVCDTSIVIITVVPVLDTVPISVPEDSVVTICPPATTNVSPIGSVVVDCAPNHGMTSTNPTTGCVTYTPDSSYVGQDTICIIICNTTGVCDTTLVPITVVPVRDTVPVTTPEDTPFTLCPPALTVVDSVGTFTVDCGPSHGTTSIDTATSCITYTPSSNFSGLDTVCVVICDVNGVCDTTVIPVTVTSVADTIPVIIPEDSTVTLCPPVLSGVSPIGSISTVCDPLHGTITLDTTTGCMTYKPDTNYVGADTVCVVTCDTLSGTCDTTVVTITVTPVLDTVPMTVPEDSMFTICPPATTNVSPIGSVVVDCAPNHGATSINTTTGCVTYTPDSSYVGQDTICIIICNTTGVCDTTLVPITVVPVRDTVPVTTPEDTPFTLCPPALTVVDSVGTFTVDCGPSHGTTSIDTATSCITYTPSSNFSGLDTICVVICDANGVCDTSVILVTVPSEADTVPVIIPEDSTVTLCPPVLSGVSPIGSISTNCGPTHGTVTLDTITGCMTYKPDTNYVGADTVCVVTCDTLSGICDTTVVTITVTPVLDTVPVTTKEDTPFTLCPPAITSVDTIGSMAITCAPKHGTAIPNPTTGCVTYSPDSNYVGKDTICIVICNTTGTCDTTFVPITVVPVRDTLTKYLQEDSTMTLCSPEITDVDVFDTLVLSCVPNNGTTSIDLVNGCISYTSNANFVGYDTLCFIKCDTNGICDTTTVFIITGPVKDTLYRTIREDDSLTICPPVISNLGGTITSITNYCGPNNGTFTNSLTSGCIVYKPDTNYVGQDSICIVTCDNLGNCDTTVVIITVTPVVDTVPITIPEDSTFTICPPNTTDTDVFGTVAIACGPNHGTVTTNPITGCVTYTADSSYVGQDTVCVVICDTAGICDTTPLVITVVPVMDTIPVTIPEDSSFTLCPPALTVVDSIGTITIGCGPTSGTTTIDTATSCVTYNPNSSFSGRDTICIIICDINGVCDTTIVPIIVIPVIDTIQVTIPEDSTVNLCPPLLSGITPIGSISTYCGPTHGTTTLDTTTGCMTYKPDTNYIGFDTVCVVTCDTIAGICDTTIVTITVTPVVDTVTVIIPEDSLIVICPPTSTDVANLGAVATICGPNHGTVQFDFSTGCVTYKPDSNYVGKDTICILICNTTGLCDTTPVVICVTPVIDTIPITIPEDSTFTLCPPALTVVDKIDSVKLICGPAHGTPSIDTATACVTYKADSSFSGMDTVCIVICDVNGVCDTSIVVITVTPETDSVPVVTYEDVPLTVSPPTLSGITPIGTITTTGGPKHGTVTTDSITGSITYTPDTNYVGYDTVTVITCDTVAMICDTTLVSITVLPVRDTVPMTIDEDSAFTVFPRTDSLTDVDSLGGTTVLIAPKFGTATVDPTTGAVTYRADTNFVGRDSVTVIVCDTIAGFCDTTLFPIFVVPVRDTIINDTMEIDTSLTLCPPFITVVDSIGSMTALCPPTYGTVTFDSTSGCVIYTPIIGYAGPDTLCFVICDTAGVCDTTTLIVEILLDIDTVPVIIKEDSTFTLCPPVTTRRRSIADLDTVCSPLHGTVILDTITGCVTYKPDTNYIGYDTVCIVTTDTNGRTDTTIITITITPVLDTVPLVIDEDSTLVVCPPVTTGYNVLGSVAMYCTPKHGTATPDPITGCVTYKPDTNYVGVDTMCVITCDTSGFCDTTTFTITIVPVRDTFYASIPADSSLVWCPRTDSTTDIDSLSAVTIVCGPSHATTTIDPLTGCMTYIGDSTYAGNDTVCIVTTDINGVSDTTTAIITLRRVFIPFTVADDTICEGSCVALLSDTMQLNVIYRVHSPRGTVIGRLPTATVCPTSDSTFYVEAYDTITGVASLWDTVTIFVTKFRSPGIDTTINICATGSIVNLFDSLGGTPDTTGTWTNPNGNPFSARYPGSFDPLTDTFGTYTYTIVNPVCPDTSATVTVVKYDAPNPGVFDSISICQNGTTTDLFNSLNGSPDNTGSWSGPSTTANGYLGTLTNLTALNGNYWYHVSKRGCADDSAYINVKVDTIEDPSIRMTDTALCKGLETAQVFILGATGGTFSMNSVPGDNISIDPTTGELTFSNRLPFRTRSGTYEVYYTTAGPCPEIDTVTITMSEYGDGCQIEIPQFISPNGDGRNDKFVIPGIEEFPENVLKIYNRWGNLVYEANKYTNNWEGRTNVNRGVNRVLGGGDMLPVGTYFYIFEPNDNRYKPFSGYVYIKK